MPEEVFQSIVTKEARAEKFAISKDPIATQTTIADPTDLASCIVAISAIIDRMQSFGLIE